MTSSLGVANPDSSICFCIGFSNSTKVAGSLYTIASLFTSAELTRRLFLNTNPEGELEASRLGKDSLHIKSCQFVTQSLQTLSRRITQIPICSVVVNVNAMSVGHSFCMFMEVSLLPTCNLSSSSRSHGMIDKPHPATAVDAPFT